MITQFFCMFEKILNLVSVSWYLPSHIKQVQFFIISDDVWKVEKSAGHLSSLAEWAGVGMDFASSSPTESDWVPTGKVSNQTIGGKRRLRGFFASTCVRGLFYQAYLSSARRMRKRHSLTNCLSWSYLLFTVFRPWTLVALGSCCGRTPSRSPEDRKEEGLEVSCGRAPNRPKSNDSAFPV